MGDFINVVDRDRHDGSTSRLQRSFIAEELSRVHVVHAESPARDSFGGALGTLTYLEHHLSGGAALVKLASAVQETRPQVRGDDW